jgi:hypothetical protein
VFPLQNMRCSLESPGRRCSAKILTDYDFLFVACYTLFVLIISQFFRGNISRNFIFTILVGENGKMALNFAKAFGITFNKTKYKL